MTTAANTFGSALANLVGLGLAVCALVLHGVPPGAAADIFAGPVLGLAVIYVWTVRREETLPPIAVFALGVGFDFVGNGTIGFWPLLYLAAYWLLYTQRRLLAGQGPFGRWLIFVVLSAAFCGALWGLGLLTTGAWPDSQTIAFGLGYGAFAYLLVAGACGFALSLGRAMAGPYTGV
jgi:cell shape-determining protein MreD